MEIQNLIAFIDIFASVSFAATGALVASRKGLDILAFMWLAVLTGVGGGTVRDLILGAPVFWVGDPSYLTICLVTAVLVYLAAPYLESRYRLLLWFDALGLAFVTVAGTAKSLDYETGALVAVVLGVVTASVGGIIRDLVGNEPSIILKREIYVTTAASGACVYVLADALGNRWVDPALAGFMVTFVIRGLAISFDWMMPGYRRPAKDTGSNEPE
ncbi:MAG: trimeric intracellular cation channel family protein [Pseudohongiellaceae bacterium]